MESKTEAYFSPSTLAQPDWILQGIIQEKQITAFGGSFNKGKSPMVQDMALHVLNGLPWCGRKTSKRPVLLFDFETPEYFFKTNIIEACKRLNVPLPAIPDQFVPFLAHGAKDNEHTKVLHAAINVSCHSTKLAILRHHLARLPNSLIICDPLELLFNVNTNKKQEILRLYMDLRGLLNDFPHAGFLCTFNLRKGGRSNDELDLMNKPHDWLEEVCGSLDLMNRCDIRLGIDKYGVDNLKVINGVVRSGTFDPIIIRPYTNGFNVFGDPIYSGWQWMTADAVAVQLALTPTLWKHWLDLPTQFRYSEVIPSRMARSTFSRLFARLRSLGVLRLTATGQYQKVEPTDPDSDTLPPDLGDTVSETDKPN